MPNAQSTAGPFATTATQYRDLGFNPVPIKPGTKIPAPSRWQTGRQEDDVFRTWLANYPEFGIGLVLGTPLESILSGGAEVKGQHLVAIDVDRNDMSEPVRHALCLPESAICAKQGKKGITYFVRATEEHKNKKISSRRDGPMKMMVEVLAAGSQTVIPPTVHPETNEPYRWIGRALLEVRMRDLQELTDSAMDEILAICEGGARAEHFDNLREMTWAGVGGGGNTHDVCVAAVASMVARGWKDTAIHYRIEFAKREACLRAGQAYDWPGSARAIQEWIDSARKKGMESPAEKKASQDRVAASWLIEQFGGPESVRSMGKGLLQYRDGHWAEQSETRALERMVLEKFSSFNAIRARSSVDTMMSLIWDSSFGHTEQARFLVCTQDGTLDARTLTMDRWSTEHELLFQVRARYDPGDTDCPKYQNLVHTMLGSDQEKIDILEEFLGWTFVQDTSFEKVLFLVGRGGIGKSTLMRVLEGIHSDRAISYVAPHDIGEPTARAGLVGKLLNIGSEKSRIKSISDDYLKKIVSGEVVEVRRLYQDYISVRLFVRFINAVNEMPDMSDYSEGLSRRLLIVACQDIPPLENPDVTYPQTVLSQERDAVFSRWMRALSRLIQRGGFFIPESIRSDVRSYIEQSSLTSLWLQERCVPLTNNDSTKCTDNEELYHDYTAWVERRVGGERWKHLSLISWGKEVKNLGFPTVVARRKDHFIRVRRLALRSYRGDSGGQNPNY